MNPHSDNQEERSETPAAPPAGQVFLVGAGPGGPEMMTLRGVTVLAKADVVCMVQEPGPELAKHREALLTHCPSDVTVVHPDECEDVNAFTVSRAKEGRNIVRLYSGDPLFGCGGGQLAAACHRAGIGFEVVPGLSAATSVPTFAGIPLMPDGVSELRVVNANDPDLDWERIAHGNASLVVMFPDARWGENAAGAAPSFDKVCKALVSGGRAATTPVAVTRMGGTTEQSTVVSTLSRLATDLKSADAKGYHVTSPGTLIVGEGVNQQRELSWFETRPLFGWRVLVPRTKEQAASLSEQLRSYGSVPEEVPTISVEPPRTPQQIERAVRGLVTGRYQWVAFTSVNAVKAIRERCEDYGLDARAFAGVKVATVGEQTAAALREFGIQPDLAPPENQQSSSGLVDVWPPYDAELDPIERVLLPRADIATETLAAGVSDLGWEVDDVTAYRTVRAAPPPAATREAIKGGGFDAVLFTSSSTVRNLVGIAGKPHNTTVIAVIGEQTAQTAEEFGLRVDVVAPKPSVSALAEALSEYGANQRSEAIAAGKPVLKPSQKRRGRRRKSM